MKRTDMLAVTIVALLLSSVVLPIVSAAPPINRPMEFITGKAEGASPETVDPAWSYDTASAELIMQVYEPLVMFDGERVDTYLPALATVWAITAISETSPEGLTWNYRYTFTIRTGVQWHNPTYGTLVPSDVEYSFERLMVMDRNGGPAWLFYEPLLNTWGSEGLGYDLSVPAEAAIVGQMIDHAVESNATHVWFNLAFPGAYAPLMQILSQTWGSVLCQAWIQTEVIANLGRPDWDGVWGDYTGWVAYIDPWISPLDDPTPVMMGCGPFEYGTLDYTLEQWDVNRFVNYWRGWPVDWPAMAGSQPAGYVDHVIATWAYEWSAREALFLAGDFDFCAVPRMYAPSIIGQDGIRLIWPLPNLACDGIFYNFIIDPTTPYGPILPAGTFDEIGIPSDFFGNGTWGVHTRKGFTLAFDYATFLSVAYLGEGAQPETAVIPGLPYYDPTIVGYPEIAPDAVAAENEFKMVPGLWDTGFTITVLYNEGNLPRMTAADIMKSTIEALNPKFHVYTVSTDWRAYMIGARYGLLPSFIVGFQVDYPDPHDFAYSFYHTHGKLSSWQSQSNPTMDALIEAGIAAPDGPGRAAIYHDIQQEAIDYCPSVIILQPIGRHFERDWVVGWYYNQLYGDALWTGDEVIRFCNLWKQYYYPHSHQSTAQQPFSQYLPFDMDYDGKADMRDTQILGASFYSYYGPPIHPRWNFRADINNDRKVSYRDLTLFFDLVWAIPPNHGGSIYLVAETSKTCLGLGYTVDVAVNIVNVTNFIGYEIRLLYNATILQLTSLLNEPMSGWNLIDMYGYQKTVDGLTCEVFSLWSYNGSTFDGNATIANITFKGLAKGNSTIDISTTVFVGAGSSFFDEPYNPVNGWVMVSKVGDITGSDGWPDDKVDMRDIGQAASAFGTRPGLPRWDPNADINNDGKVDMKDIGTIARNFGQ